jgi:hypothetical protein
MALTRLVEVDADSHNIQIREKNNMAKLNGLK